MIYEFYKNNCPLFKRNVGSQEAKQQKNVIFFVTFGYTIENSQIIQPINILEKHF